MTTPVTPPSVVSPLECHAAVRRLWDYLDNELDTLRAHEVAHHLAKCRECGAHYDFAAKFLRELRAKG